MIRRAVKLTVIPFLLATACMDASPPSDLRCRVQVDLVAQLGSRSDPASISSVYATDVVRWRDGWAVLESGPGHMVLTYSSQGAFREFIGRLGSGPDEFENPVRMVADPTDSLWVSERGRVVVFGPDGQPARSISNPAMFPIDGFTPAGRPFSYLAALEPNVNVLGFAHILNRDGSRRTTLGPGANLPDLVQRWSPFVPPARRLAALNDSVILEPGGHAPAVDDWVFQWNISSRQVVLTRSDVWRALRLPEEPFYHSVAPGTVVGITADTHGGFWVLAAMRRLDPRNEAVLIEETASQTGIAPNSYRARFAPGVANEAYEGLLVHVDSTRRITAATTFDEYPWGFADSGHYYTFVESEDGMLRPHLWGFFRACG